ncbi:hypothetical protein [Endozoicomonas sp.]|uniref:hypothetical protein n=1 Tax=Endozoicomonas sp. TaxID=1892382 RepID=UPI00383B0B5F
MEANKLLEKWEFQARTDSSQSVEGRATAQFTTRSVNRTEAALAVSNVEERVTNPQGGTNRMRFISRMISKFSLSRSHQISDNSIPITKEKYKRIVNQLIHGQQLPLSDIPLEDIDNMALGLQFAGVTTKEIKRDNYQIIKPGPVIYTWVALYGTTIFDGTDQGEGERISSHFNYVARIQAQADRLKKQDIPVLVIYSQVNMTMDQINTMESVFNDSDNIVVLNVENDLGHLEEFKLMKNPNGFGLSYPAREECQLMLDRIRIAALREGQNTLDVAKKKAKTTHKTRVENTLVNNQNNSLMYMDTDNHWFERIPYMVAPDGMYSAPKMNPECDLSKYATYCEEHPDLVTEALKQNIKKRQEFLGSYQVILVTEALKQNIKKHQVFLGSYQVMRPWKEGHQEINELSEVIKRTDKYRWSQEDSRKSFLYMCKEFKKNFNTIIGQWKQMNLPNLSSFGLDKIEPESIWCGENSLISFNLKEKSIFVSKTAYDQAMLDFHKHKYKPHYLAALQTWRYLFMGYDESWKISEHQNPSKVLL